MEKQQRDEVIQSLEKFRTDQPMSSKGGDNQPFIENNFEQKKRWFKRISISAVFIFIFSISITVYANYGDIIGSKEQKAAEQQSKVMVKPKQSVKPEKKGSPEADEAFHLEFKNQVVKDTPKQKVSTKQRRTPTRLSPPPQPKKQDKPALRDQPIQVPDQYRQRHQNSRVQPEEKEKKK